MFFKLLKYDIVDDLKKKLVAFSVTLASLALCLIPFLTSGEQLNSTAAYLISLGSMASYVGMILMLVTVLTRFHRTLFTRELYLTFTRPASHSLIILSKLLAGVILLFIPVFASTVASSLLIDAMNAIPELSKELSQMDMAGSLVNSDIKTLVLESPALFAPLVIFDQLFTVALTVSLAALAITFASLIPKTSKFLAGIGIYFGSSIVISLISEISSSALAMSLGAKLNDGGLLLPESMFSTYYLGSLIISIVVSLAAVIASFFIIRLIINKRLPSHIV